MRDEFRERRSWVIGRIYDLQEFNERAIAEALKVEFGSAQIDPHESVREFLDSYVELGLLSYSGGEYFVPKERALAS